MGAALSVLECVDEVRLGGFLDSHYGGLLESQRRSTLHSWKVRDDLADDTAEWHLGNQKVLFMVELLEVPNRDGSWPKLERLRDDGWLQDGVLFGGLGRKLGGRLFGALASLWACRARPTLYFL